MLLIERVPVCSTVVELYPSRPTQNAAYAVPVPFKEVTVHDPLTELKVDPEAAITAYPLQLEL